jgi:hypothetical protein
MPGAHILAIVLTVVFVIGVAGCALVIPIAAIKFFAVLFEKDASEEPAPGRFVQLG